LSSIFIVAYRFFSFSRHRTLREKNQKNVCKTTYFMPEVYPSLLAPATLISLARQDCTEFIENRITLARVADFGAHQAVTQRVVLLPTMCEPFALTRETNRTPAAVHQ
jgi:hypothetical protein